MQRVIPIYDRDKLPVLPDDAKGFPNTSLTTLPPLSLYVHFPWCVKKCPYCDFNSHEVDKTAVSFPETLYLEALRLDLEAALPLIWGRKVYTVFIGGGTPSLLSAQGLDRLLSDIRALVPLDSSAEITMEANPGTFEAKKFESYALSGVNRLSMGIQSFHDHHLKALGRIHSAYEAYSAIDLAQKYIEHCNIDLMYALPNQTLDEAAYDIKKALATGVSHISYYHLTIEPNTWFSLYPPCLPDEDVSAHMQDCVADLMRQESFNHYEVSAYAKKGREARHNLNYWQFGDYIGIGAGAHSKLSFPQKIVREMRYKSPRAYLKGATNRQFIQEAVEISPHDRVFEFMLNALRLTEGFSSMLFEERTGLNIAVLAPLFLEAEKKGLLSWEGKNACPTDLGKRFLNDLQQMFLISDTFPL